MGPVPCVQSKRDVFLIESIKRSKEKRGPSQDVRLVVVPVKREVIVAGNHFLMYGFDLLAANNPEVSNDDTNYERFIEDDLF